jgi:hypothetical protein
MLTVYDDRNKKLYTFTSQDEVHTRTICEQNPKLFQKNQDKEDRTIFNVTDGTEAKLPSNKKLYLYKKFRLEFLVS